ncbi:glycine--tRNA ligase subunit beta [Reinekea marinisedimentorum]|uniref:Glycine--tRNA ligase beta subunit n=1 Tax=Reinekea marinisedimentorum TaxID=230495 RepID=A0A4V2UKD2_9GAMM|nr:glycine--tRNA ligase subunit beta [Reinekea marinisedimentorum]TCS43903.1 glycyl-tRNA synthetase beta chain [Reinekea marinisedimentorum]
MSTADFLIELGTEELPPKALRTLKNAFADGIIDRLKAAGVNFESTERFGAPRRLALTLTGLDLQQPDETIERRGPSVAAAFDADGNPTKAVQGFARGCGVSVDELETVETPKGPWLMYRGTKPGQATKELLPSIVQETLDSLPIPKRMRWGARRDEFVRPVKWLLMLLGEEVVPATVYGVESGNTTRGHRFHAPKEIVIKRAADYESTLMTEGKVMASFAKRHEKIAADAKQAASSKGVVAVIDSDLLDEVTALNEWPVALVGQFEERFLEVPAEALMSSMEEHQKYFPTVNTQGEIQPYFVFIANIESQDPQIVVEGNEKVIRPRLADAAFFWETDKKTPLADRVEKLKTVMFQQQLGSVYNKVERIQKTAGYIAGKIDASVSEAERAAYLSKADLVTDMVFEFTDLQGIAGRYYAIADGEAEAVAEAILEQYKPAGAGDALPETREGMAVALSDRLDNLSGLFGIGQPPTGTKDPFALRRAALGVLRIIVERELDLDLVDLVTFAADQHADLPQRDEVVSDVVQYVLDRFSAWYADEGFRAEIFQSVRALALTNPYDIDLRVRAVAEFSKLEQAEALAAGNKRVSNILSKADVDISDEVNPSLFEEAAERELFAALDSATSVVSTAVAEADYTAALNELAGLRDVVDSFFDGVMVNADDEKIRLNRLALLAKLRSLFMQVADISVL